MDEDEIKRFAYSLHKKLFIYIPGKSETSMWRHSYQPKGMILSKGVKIEESDMEKILALIEQNPDVNIVHSEDIMGIGEEGYKIHKIYDGDKKPDFLMEFTAKHVSKKYSKRLNQLVG